MQIVMPAVVKHSNTQPYMAMARPEVGENGNPHWHGFSMGIPGPRVTRVEADVQGEGDLPPDTLTGDVRVVLKRFESKRGRKAWLDGAENSCDEVRELFRLFLKGDVGLKVFFSAAGGE